MSFNHFLSYKKHQICFSRYTYFCKGHFTKAA